MAQAETGGLGIRGQAARDCSFHRQTKEAAAVDVPGQHSEAAHLQGPRQRRRYCLSADAGVRREPIARSRMPGPRPKRACARCERRRPLPSSSSSPHALAWERASRPKPAMLAVNLVLRAMRVEQDLARSDSRARLGFSVQECSRRGSGRWEEKGRSVPCSADPHRGDSRRRWRAARAGVCAGGTERRDGRAQARPARTGA